MATHRALILRSRDKPLALETVPRPIAKAGQAVVRILCVGIVPYMSQVLDGSRPYPLSLPMTPGNSAIGRVVEVGPDAVELAPGHLVFCDITIRARDNPNISILFGIHGGGYSAAQKLMDGEWRDATYAEYTRFPLENLHRLNEEILFNKLGYKVSDLCLLPVCLVPFGGLSEVDVKPGEVVIVAPATGRYGGAAVAVALAMGATVVAAGRNKNALQALEDIHAPTGRLKTVTLVEDATGLSNAEEALKTATGKAEGADVYIDFSPPAMKDNSLLVAAVAALRPFGRLVLMGGHSGEIRVPYLDIMFKSIRIQGRFMYSRQHVLQLIQMAESGLLKFGSKLGIKKTQEFGLESIGDALEAAGKLSGFGSHVVLRP